MPRRRPALALASTALLVSACSVSRGPASGLLALPLRTLDGEATTLAAQQGEALLIVNVASQCGLTPQYAGLESLQQRFGARGLRVIGFPCNQFGGQEPGSAEEIAAFCETEYAVSFPLMAKIEVNGPGRHPLYQELTAAPDAQGTAGEVQWNFEKFLVSADGRVLARFRPRTAPDAPEVLAAIESALPPLPGAQLPSMNESALPAGPSAYNPLTPAEARVLLQGGTERAFTGEYTSQKASGTYLCRQCNAALYRSQDKFDSQCGWPSFDDELAGAVLRLRDPDGRRVEIRCVNCGGHLGHVFEGEGFTPKDTRHCVNSISLRFVPEGESLPAKIVLPKNP